MINFMIHLKLLKSTYSFSKQFGQNSATLLFNKFEAVLLITVRTGSESLLNRKWQPEI